MSALAKALLAFQTDPPPVHLDATNPHFRSRYASLGGVVAAVRPALAKHGLAYTQLPTNLDGSPALQTILMHADTGEQLEATTPLVLPKQDPQGYGSALTYQRRYALLSVLGLVGDDDDDANAAQPQARATSSEPEGSRVSTEPRHTSGSDSDPVVHFGKNSGKRLSELTAKQVEWYATSWEPNPKYANETDHALKQAAVAKHLGADGIATAVKDDVDDLPF